MHPKKLLPRRNWVSVLDDKRKEITHGGLYLPGYETGIEKVTEGTGTIVRLGPGNKADGLNLREGDKILYRGYLKHASRLETEDVWHDGIKKHYFLIDIEDILAVVEHGVEVGVFSGRPATGDLKHG